MIFLLIPVMTINAQETKIISIGINGGRYIHNSVTNRIQNAIDNYSWVVNDTEYIFYTTIMNMSDSEDENIYLYYDVHIIDGVTDEILNCTRSKLNTSWDNKAENLRKKLEEAINDGHGFIGRCGGSELPPEYDQPRPDGMGAYYFITQNAFLEDIKVHVNLDVQILSQYFKMKYWFFNRPQPRLIQDPGALGSTAYSSYGSSDDSAINQTKNIHGFYVDLVNLNYEHPILKDYFGDTIYTHNMGGGGFPDKYLPNYVDRLAYYPANCAETDPKQDVTIWECKPVTTRMAIRFKQLVTFLKDNIFSILSVEEDVPYVFREEFGEQPYTCGIDLINTVTLDTPWWYKNQNGEKIKTEVQNKPAIIAFEYQSGQHGRVVLSGPHVANKVLVDKNSKIVDMENPGFLKNSGKLGVNISEGLFHWQKTNDEWVDRNDSEDMKFNEDLYWYQRREAAWASTRVEDDDYLPPVYGNSQIVDIDPYRWDSNEIPIIFCVGKNSNESWSWNSNVSYLINLSLFYKYNATNKNGDYTNWTYYNSSLTGRPYYLIFNASNASGSGYYKFCSILKVFNISNSSYDVNESFPPENDAGAGINVSVSAEFSSNAINVFTMEPVNFNSSASTTIQNTTITNYSWDFDDGNISYETNPTHVFNDNGVYNVQLTVENSVLAVDNFTRTIIVHNRPPQVNFNPEIKIVFTGENIDFVDNSSDTDGNITNYFWDFDDGTNSTQQNNNHTFTRSGFYTVSLEITDDDNDTNNTVSNILVIDSLVNKSQTPGDHIWNNINDALDNTSCGEYIYIENGTYYENITINKSINLLGEDKNNVVIHGSVSMVNPHDFELPTYKDVDLSIIVNMTGNILLMRFNNESIYGENYSNSDLVYDYSGENNNGTRVGATWTTSTIKGSGAFLFNGINDSININCIPDLADSSVTVSGWVYWTNDSSTIDPIISQSSSSDGYCLYLNGTTCKPVFCLNNVEAVSSVNVGYDEWHYIVGTYDGETLRIYVDGFLVGSNNITSSGVNTGCYIGNDDNNYFYSGILDEICVWNRTLPDDEIRLIYDGNKHIVVEGVTFQDSDIGLSVCNHSEIIYCDFKNNTIGLLLDNASDTEISMCNITNCTIGVKIVDSVPESFYFNNVVDCYIDDTDFGIVVENSTYINLIRNLVNGTNCNMSFNDGSDFGNISTINCDSLGNVAPSVPNLWGPNLGEINKTYTFYACTNDSNDDQILYRFDWDDGNISSWLHLFVSNETVNASHVWPVQGGYLVKVKAKDVFDNESNWSSPVLFRTETLMPIINSFNNTPDVVGFGEGVTINANVTDDETGNFSGIKTVHVIITLPDDTTCNYTMNSICGDVFEYVFSGTWFTGQYNYTIGACDNAYNWNNSNDVGCFNVSAQANMSICTIKDSYGGNEIINLTDPPGSNPVSQGVIGYELMDNGSVLHVWSSFDHYYFNTSNGIQFTNHFNKYWSHNVLMLGYYNNEEWNLVYRTDELSGFSKNILSDNESFVNVTLWKDLSYSGYDFRLAIRYYLGVDDNELTVIPYIKNLGVEIPFVLGFAWELKDIQVDMTFGGDYITINGNSYFLNSSLDETYTDLSNPCFYIKEDFMGNSSESLYLRWDENLDYKVQVKSRTGQYNAPVTLGIKIGTLSVGQEKYTCLFWHDASEVVYYFNDYDTMECWDDNPVLMVDESVESFAMTDYNGTVELCSRNTCGGEDLGVISKVEFRVNSYHDGESSSSIILRPVFNGVTDGENYTYETPLGESAWSSWFNITEDEQGPWGLENQSWSWSDVRNLMCDVEAYIEDEGQLFCSMVEIRVTYNCVPVVSDPFPVHGSMDVALCPLLNITVVDGDGDCLNVTWYSNCSGSWQVFGVNNSVYNGTYYQVFSNASENGQWWYWKVMVDDGSVYVNSSVFKFYTGCQSRIVNTGSTNISGYLLMQIDYLEGEEWVLDSEVVNETDAETIIVGGQLGLDDIFNPEEVNTDSLAHGSGTYRVYAAFHDPFGDVLVCDDDSLLEASYEFTVNFN